MFTERLLEITRGHTNIQRDLTASTDKEIRNVHEIRRLRWELVKQRATVAESTEKVEESGDLISTHKRSPAAIHASLLHVREVTSNFINSLKNEDTAPYNYSTKLRLAYGLARTTSGGRKL